jgi:hypothetical protein
MQGMWVADTADVILNASRVAGNQGNHSGAGMSLYGSSRVLITGSSTVADNICYNCTGGGVALSDNASLTVSGGSTIVNNTSHDAAAGGGGVLLMDISSLVLRGGSGIVNNTSFHTGGAGVAAWGNASMRIEEGSYVSGNQAIVHIGMVAGWWPVGAALSSSLQVRRLWAMWLLKEMGLVLRWLM